MSDIEEVELVVENFVEEYGGVWDMLKAKMESIGRTDEAPNVATAKVNLILKDAVVIGDSAFFGSKNLSKVMATCASEVRQYAFSNCSNLSQAFLPIAVQVHSNTFMHCRKLIEVALPNALSIDERAFLACYALRHIKIHPKVNIAKVTFFASLSLEVLATCAGFELNAGDVTPTYGNLDPTVAITSYLKSQCELDRQQRDIFLTYNLLLKLCNYHIDKKTGKVRAWPLKEERLANFLYDNKDPARHILSFFGMKWGKKDLRNASHQRLLELGLQKKV
eukprot:CAMPEP_0118643192 /NCGR_PEP_ID=MMETSP0785-20121206/6262_1 /TAXON_ID=91992 /ORGANISM="Bolidomonas pacifica, Strain CCMP 1866" /LENGTH=277 /DNA_ID=CAMNT_0006534843 /DNA_START=160 /DNA_END=989 /DNA_ORIENTATION=-